MQRTLPFLQGRREDGDRKHDILYGVLRREDVNWRNLSGSLSKRLLRRTNSAQWSGGPLLSTTALQTRRERRSKLLQSLGSHRRAHGSRAAGGRAGNAGEAGFLPVDRQIFMGDKNAVHKPEDKDFSDKRNAAARDMARAE
ncbi:MAG: hypothetical protein R3F19_31925 [Verrucomicrobiales bacterium]